MSLTGNELQQVAGQVAGGLSEASSGYPFTEHLRVWKVVGNFFLIITKDDPSERRGLPCSLSLAKPTDCQAESSSSLIDTISLRHINNRGRYPVHHIIGLRPTIYQKRLRPAHPRARGRDDAGLHCLGHRPRSRAIAHQSYERSRPDRRR